MCSGKPPVDDDFEAAFNEFLNRRTEYIDPSAMYPEYDGVRGRSMALFERLMEMLATEEARKMLEEYSEAETELCALYSSAVSRRCFLTA